jgi:hypothetical protein
VSVFVGVDPEDDLFVALVVTAALGRKGHAGHGYSSHDRLGWRMVEMVSDAMLVAEGVVADLGALLVQHALPGHAFERCPLTAAGRYGGRRDRRARPDATRPRADGGAPRRGVIALRSAIGELPIEVATAGELARLLARVPAETPLLVDEHLRIDPDLDEAATETRRAVQATAVSAFADEPIVAVNEYGGRDVYGYRVAGWMLGGSRSRRQPLLGRAGDAALSGGTARRSIVPRRSPSRRPHGLRYEILAGKQNQIPETFSVVDG